MDKIFDYLLAAGKNPDRASRSVFWENFHLQKIDDEIHFFANWVPIWKFDNEDEAIRCLSSKEAKVELVMGRILTSEDLAALNAEEKVKDYPLLLTDTGAKSPNLKPFYFTCGHRYSLDGFIWDKDSVLQVMAENERGARAKVFSLVEDKWSFCYTWQDLLDMSFFPKGICCIIFA